MPKDQARKSRDSKRRRWWIIKAVDGSEYEVFTVERQSALAIAREKGIKVKSVYYSKEGSR